MDLQEHRLEISAIQMPARLAQLLRGSGRRTHREGEFSKTASLNKQANAVQHWEGMMVPVLVFLMCG